VYLANINDFERKNEVKESLQSCVSEGARTLDNVFQSSTLVPDEGRQSISDSKGRPRVTDWMPTLLLITDS